MRNLFSLFTVFSLISLVLCQQYIDVHVCDGFDNSSPIQVSVTVGANSWRKNTTFASCASFQGVTSVGASMTATFDIVQYTPTGPSSTFTYNGQNTLVENSGQNVFIIYSNPAGTALQFRQLFSTADNRALPPTAVNSALYVAGNFATDLNRVNFTFPGMATVGPLDREQKTDPALLAPVVTNQSPTTTIRGYYTNTSSSEQFEKVMNFPADPVSPINVNTWEGSTYYALLCGSIGQDLSGSGYRVIGNVKSFGIAFNNTGSAPVVDSSTGPAGNNTYSSSGPNNNAAQSTIDITSPLLFIFAALFALFTTQL